MAKILIILGIIFIVAGILIYVNIPLGRLPGDIVIKSEHTQFYFPIVTCIVVSIVLSILFYLFAR